MFDVGCQDPTRMDKWIKSCRRKLPMSWHFRLCRSVVEVISQSLWPINITLRFGTGNIRTPVPFWYSWLQLCWRSQKGRFTIFLRGAIHCYSPHLILQVCLELGNVLGSRDSKEIIATQGALQWNVCWAEKDNANHWYTVFTCIYHKL